MPHDGGDLLVELLGSVCNDAVEDSRAAWLAPALTLLCCVDAVSWQDEGHGDCPSPVLCYNPLRSKDGYLPPKAKSSI
jgi:hypothetical protein